MYVEAGFDPYQGYNDYDGIITVWLDPVTADVLRIDDPRRDPVAQVAEVGP